MIETLQRSEVEAGLPALAGFATEEQVRTACALLGGVGAQLGGPGTTLAGRLGTRYRLGVSPGSVRLRVLQRPEGWEPVPSHRPRMEEDEAVRFLAGAFGHVVDVTHDRRARRLRWQEPDDDDQAPLEMEPGEDLPAYSSWWSARSRARMVRVLASVDWAPVLSAAGCRPAMVTLTYPGDWLAVAPDSAVAKAHLAALRKALGRLYALNGLDRPGCVWKLEFQARGAPHFHCYLPVPVGVVRWKVGRGRGSSEVSGRFAEWLSSTWAAIVGAEGDERGRHVAAGTGVDFAEGSRMSDPKRLAVYFVRHNAKGSRSKEYQHRVPDEWVKAGRWWGTWNLDRLELDVGVEAWELNEARRFLRRWVESQHVKGAPRVSPVPAPRGITAGGRRRSRWVARRYRIRSLHHSLGGFVICNDGPGLAAALARHLDGERAKRAGPSGRPSRVGFLP